MKKLLNLFLFATLLLITFSSAIQFNLNPDAIAVLRNESQNQHNASFNLSGFNSNAIAIIRSRFNLPQPQEPPEPRSPLNVSIDCRPFNFNSPNQCNHTQTPRLANGILNVSALLNRTKLTNLIRHPIVNPHVNPMPRIDCLPFHSQRFPNIPLCPPDDNQRPNNLPILRINLSHLNVGLRLPVANPPIPNNDAPLNVTIELTPHSGSVDVNWNSNLPVNYNFAASSAVNPLESFNSVQSEEFALNGLVSILTLLPNTIYNFSATLCTQNNHCSRTQMQFTTLPAPACNIIDPARAPYDPASPEYDLLVEIAQNYPSLCQAQNELDGQFQINNLVINADNNSANLTWETNPLTNTTLFISIGDYIERVILNATKSSNHFETIQNLAPNTTYNALIQACSVNNCTYRLTTIQTINPVIPVELIPIELNITAVPTNSTINVTYISNYEVNGSIIILENGQFLIKHNIEQFKSIDSINFLGLLPNTHYKLISTFCNAENTCVANSTDVNTLANEVNPNNPEQQNAPQIQEISITPLTHSANIKWSTDVEANETLVIFNEANEIISTTINATLATSHYEHVQNLQPDTTYYAVIYACTENCTSEIVQFTTNPVHVNPDDPNENELTINITTNTTSNSIQILINSNKAVNATTDVYLAGRAIIYNYTINNSDYEENKTINITNLLANQKYKVVTTMCTELNECIESILFTQTLNASLGGQDIPLNPTPQFTNVKVNIQGDTAAIIWNTNVNTNHTLLVFNDQNTLIDYNTNPALVTDHSHVALHLIINNTYVFGIKACTELNTCNTTTGAFYVNETGLIENVTPIVDFNAQPNPFQGQNQPPAHVPLVEIRRSGSGRVIFLKDGCEFTFNGNGTLGNCTIANEIEINTPTPAINSNGNSKSSGNGATTSSVIENTPIVTLTVEANKVGTLQDFDARKETRRVNLAELATMTYKHADEQHYIIVKQVTRSNVTLTLASKPFDTTLQIGEEKSYDITDDKKEDITIKLIATNGKTATLEITPYSAKSAQNNQTNENQNANNTNTLPNWATGGNGNVIDTAIAALVLLLIALVIVSTAAYILYKHKQEANATDAVTQTTTPVTPTSVENTPTPVTTEEPSKFAALNEAIHEPAPETKTETVKPKAKKNKK